jgi:hypothetical protein
MSGRLHVRRWMASVAYGACHMASDVLGNTLFLVFGFVPTGLSQSLVNSPITKSILQDLIDCGIYR